MTATGRSSHAATAASPPIVTLTTDFGLADPFVGLVKARILARCPAARLVDLTHDIPAFSAEAAGFWVDRCHGYFPVGTVHLAVVDPGVGTDRAVLAAGHAGQVFLAPDNGLLGPIARRPGAEVRIVGQAALERLGIVPASATFHGRDLFAPLSGALANREVALAELGELTEGWQRPPPAEPELTADRILGRIVWIDKFGNCFSNIESDSLLGYELTAVRFGDHRLPLVRTYGDGAPGQSIAVVNAFGLLEAATVEGRAAEVLRLALGAPVEVVRCSRDPDRS